MLPQTDAANFTIYKYEIKFSRILKNDVFNFVNSANFYISMI